MSLAQFNWQLAKLPDKQQWSRYDTPVGSLIVHTQGKLLCKMQWLTGASTGHLNLVLPDQLQQELHKYWLNSHAPITIALMHQGTIFQRQVWNALCQIPFAQTRTYGELAKELSTSPRALANACRKNPFPLIIPCHRVLAQTGIGGYAGAVTGKLIEIKKALLQHEQIIAHEAQAHN